MQALRRALEIGTLAAALCVTGTAHAQTIVNPHGIEGYVDRLSAAPG